VNPIILNPDPLAILKESNRINDPTRQPRVKDAFTIVDGSRTKASAWGSDADFSNSIKTNFDYTADNFNEAKLRAAREGRPLVVVSGANNADTKQLVENTIPGAKNGPQSAIYVFADVAKLDPNSELGRKMSASKGDTSRPYTAIFAPKADASGNPQLEDHIANTWGARAEVGTVIQQQLGSAQTIMDSRKGSFKVADGSKGASTGDGTRGFKVDTTPGDAPPKPDQTTSDKSLEPKTKGDAGLEKRTLEDAAEGRLAPNIKKVIESFQKLNGSNFTQRETLYDTASKAAAELDPKDIALVKEKTERDLKEELGKGDTADKKTLETLGARQKVLDLMTTAPSWVNMNHGMSLLHYSQLDKGVEKIREGAKSSPESLNNPQFIEQLLKTPYEVSKLKEKLPEVKFDDYLKHKKAGTLDQFIAANKPEPKPEVKVEPTAPPEVKVEKAIKAPEQLKYDGAQFEKSLEDAFNSGRMVVVKVGAPDCQGCKDMTEKAWPDKRVADQLKENAVFTDVNAEIRDDIQDQYKPKQWPAVLVLEPYKDEAGKIQGRLVQKFEPANAEEQSANSLNKFLSDNLRKPNPVDVVKPVAPPVKAPEVLPAEAKPAVKPTDVQPAEVKPVEVQKPEAQPEVKEKPKPLEMTKEEQTAFLNLQTAQKKILAPLAALQPNADPKTIDAAFATAIASAKEVRPEDVKLATQALERHKAEVLAGQHNPADDPKVLLAKIETDSRLVTKIDQTEAYLNVSRGAVKLKLNPETPESGIADIRKGLDLRKEIAQSTSVIGKIHSTGISADKLKSWFPEVPELPAQPNDQPVAPPDQPVAPKDQPAAPTDQPAAPNALDPANVKAAADRLYDQHALNLQSVMNIPANASKAEVQTAYKTAIENSQKVNPADVQLMVASLDAQRAEIIARAKGGPLSAADQADLNSVELDRTNYSRIGLADGILHVSLGVREMTMDPTNPEEGIESVRKGLALRKELLSDPSVTDKLRSVGFSDRQIGQYFPGLTLERVEKPGTQPGPQPKPDPSQVRPSRR